MPAGLDGGDLVSLTTVRFVAAVVAEVDRGGAGEAGAGDRHGCRRPRAAGRAEAGDRREPRTIGELIGGDVVDVPPSVVTVTSTVPAARRAVGGDLVSLTTVKLVAAVVPKSTAVAPVKPVPVIVTGCRRPCEPLVGLRPVTVGAAHVGELIGARCGRRRPACVTVTSTVPVPGGLSSRDRGVVDDGEARRRRRAEVDRRGAGEAGAGDRHRGAAGRLARWSGSGR